ncbi:hypothetical protein [Ramlibacter tataouinensis]|uniref:Molecular chaperone DnaJ n=1 Tax=Ramlibacter tataouinensis (strain ATCC BAA-407 / DSM 14655 / LMG 21543 / TTB310) TaxID=365046 RepID=F5Y5M6_RAMTT|nr:hypothetical protein [Ramlibacter tataouinensis]AEG92722.1 hypothetical protein Rta_16300 [Ramlibacter tataouinensis TTB310]
MAAAEERASRNAPLDLSESVAGEEDPGASVDLAVRDEKSPGATDQPAGAAGARPGAPTPPMSRGDEAPPGTPGTGEDVCPSCGGSGRLQGSSCPNCDGTGKVTVGIGGA